MRVGFTGTQRGMTEDQQRVLKRALRAFLPYWGMSLNEFHHGDCIGADAEAHDMVVELRLEGTPVEIYVHPPDNESKRAFKGDEDIDVNIEEPLPYPVRNRLIVQRSEILVACPKEMSEQLRSGTWSTVRKARVFQRELKIIYPDGSIGD